MKPVVVELIDHTCSGCPIGAGTVDGSSASAVLECGRQRRCTADAAHISVAATAASKQNAARLAAARIAAAAATMASERQSVGSAHLISTSTRWRRRCSVHSPAAPQVAGRQPLCTAATNLPPWDHLIVSLLLHRNLCALRVCVRVSAVHICVPGAQQTVCTLMLSMVDRSIAMEYNTKNRYHPVLQRFDRWARGSATLWVAPMRPMARSRASVSRTRVLSAVAMSVVITMTLRTIDHRWARASGT